MKLYQFVSRCAELYNPINIGAQNICGAHFRPEWTANATELSTPAPRGPIVHDDYTPVVDYLDRCRLHLIGS